jgi:phosphoribosylglycinamide formyltransferase 1
MLEASVPVTVVLADRPCRALQVAESAGRPTELVDRASFGGFQRDFDRQGYSAAVTAALGRHRPDLLAMAGFGTVLSESVHDAYPARILNTHPSLLPAFPGWHAVADALSAGARVTGCTVHLATVVVDDGPILAQEEVQVVRGDDVESLHERIKEVERRLYPATVNRAVAELGVSGSLDRLVILKEAHT